MEPGVPFALLGAVQLLALAGWVGLAGAAVARRGRHAPGLGLPLLLAGVVLLSVADGRTALGFDTAVDDGIAGLRAAGLLVLGLGLLLGALGGRTPRPADPPPGPLSLVALPGVVVPLGAGSTTAVLGGLAGLAAAAAAVRARRDAVGALLGLSLLSAGVAAVVSASADGETGAVGVLVLRGASALLLLAALSLLARRSLLSKVVTAILGGVLVMAVAAVGVVGTVVVASYDQQDRDLVRDAAIDRQLQLEDFVASRLFGTTLLATACGQLAGGTAVPLQCSNVFNQLAPRRDAVVSLPRTGTPRVLLASSGVTVTPSELVGLSGVPEVRTALAQSCRSDEFVAPVSSKVRLPGAAPSLIGFAVAPEGCVGGRVPSVLVYLTRIDDGYARDLVGADSYTFSILVGDELAATNASTREQGQLLRAAQRAGVDGGIEGDGVTVAADGLQPTFRFVPLKAAGQTYAVLVVGRDSATARDAQQEALRYLVGTALVTTLLVGGLALLLGRRTVDPVRRLTAAAEQVAAGDLSVRTAVPGQDEVGTLSRAFDTMTSSLEAVNADLRSSADRVRTILTSVGEGLVATDAAGAVTTINPAALAMAGLPDEQAALGRALTDVVVVRTPAGEAVPLGSPLGLVDAQVVRVDGTTTDVRLEVAELTGGSGGVVVVLRDTAREREVERMKTEFLSNVSHELRTPLTPIRGYADLLAHRKGLSPEQVATFAGTILSESLKMNRVVDLLVDVAAIEAGRVHTSPTSVSATAIVDAQLARWRAKAPEREADLRRRVARGLPLVHVDAAWIAKALDELVDNALRHTPPGTAITLAASAGAEGHVRLSVLDRGPGIAEADQALLFTSFEQVDGSATRKVGGLGLGLSFVSRLAEHGGYPLSVVSAPGKGAEFSIEVPAAGAPPARAVRRRGASPARGSRAARRPAPGPGPDR